MDINILISNSQETIQKSQSIRHDIFVKEQGIPLELDLDGLDTESLHALAQVGDKSIGTARLTIADESHAILARVAVTRKFRGSGVANQLVHSLLSYARKHGLETIKVHAHEHLRKYYESIGFSYISDAEVVGEHPLIAMHLKVQNR